MSSQRDLEALKSIYLNPTPDRQVDQKVIDLVSEYVVPRLPGVDVLELGVGDQIWTPKLVGRVSSVTTVDGSIGGLAGRFSGYSGFPRVAKRLPNNKITSLSVDLAVW